ncbi:MAG: 23S rRNA (guanosine(2251)-2'-O)-methyltransferase RlmB [Chloroflexota bacterium]
MAREILYGRNAVQEALRAKRRKIYSLQLAKNLKPSPLIQSLIEQSQKHHIPLKRVDRRQLDNLGGGHQGVALEVSSLPLIHIDDLIEEAKKKAQSPFFLALDHLEDPQNVGALCRTAEAVGVQGIILPERRAVGITPTVVKASAGATEHLKFALVTNLVQCLKSLKQQGLWVVGSEKHETSQPYYQIDLDMPIVIALGQEGKGLTRLVRQTCDLLLELPMQGEIASLNVSAAGAVILYEVWKAQNKAGSA